MTPLQTSTICSGEAVNYKITLTPSGLPSTTKFSWSPPAMSDGSGQGTASPAGGVLQSNPLHITDVLVNKTGLPITATYSVSAMDGVCSNTGLPSDVVITINSEAVAQPVSTLARCSGDPINFNLQDIINNIAPFAGGNSVTSDFTYTVTADFPNDLSPAVSAGSFDRPAKSNAPISNTFSNFSNHDVTLIFHVIPISQGSNCAGAPFIVNVVYHAEPAGSDFSEPSCNTSLNHDIQTQITNGVASVFTYTISQVPAGALVLPADRTAKSAAPITDSYVNATGSPVVVTYTISAFNSGFPLCGPGVIFTYDATISPKPVGITDTKPARCSDEYFTIDPQGNISPV